MKRPALTELPIHMAEVGGKSVPAERNDTVTIIVDASGRLHYQQASISRAQLVALCSSMKQEQANQLLTLACDKSTPFESVAATLQAIRQTGFDASLLTLPGQTSLPSTAAAGKSQ